MSRRPRRALPLVLSTVLALGLSSCGDEEGGGGSADAPLEQVTISGDQGKEPEVEWGGRLEATDVSSETVTEGDGEEVAAGDQVYAHIWIGNGFSQETAFSTYENGEPELLTADEETLSEVFLEGIEGHTIGSRVAVAAPASEAFGEGGNPTIGIGNKDSVLVVVDLMEAYVEPEPQDVPKAQQPSVVERKGEPVELDFSGIDEPAKDGDLLRTVLEEGDGKELTTDDTVKVDYLGMVYDGKKPFDTSYDGEPAEFQLTQVVQGWTYGLEGVKVGSRVLLTIPPELGYGSQEQANIPADSTLYFVIDVISAK